MIWQEKYELGVARVDEQHRELFQRVETFIQTLRISDSEVQKLEKIRETLLYMNEYVELHFKDEEDYQRNIGYPGYEEHKKIHENLKIYVMTITEQFKSRGFDEEQMQLFAGKILAWLINHVATEDNQIAAYARIRRRQG